MTDLLEHQSERDARIAATIEAYREGRITPGTDGKPARPKPVSEISPLWEAMWHAFDFSWEGLADAAWSRGDEANAAQEIKRWRAPADFPGDGQIHNEGGETAWKEGSLQDYWRWSAGIVKGVPCLLSDAELEAAGLLVRRDDVLWHVLHCPDVRVSVALDSAKGKADVERTGADRELQRRGGEGTALDRLLIARLSAASGLQGDDAPDGRVQFVGVRAVGLDNRLAHAL